MVGAIGFEPTTPCAQGRCATRLRYAPTLAALILNYITKAGQTHASQAQAALVPSYLYNLRTDIFAATICR